MVRLGIVSTAHLHADSYVAQIARNRDAELVGLWDDDARRLATKSEEYGVPAFTELAQLLAACDAVVVCSANAHHRAHVEAAASMGKHVLCEKPLATSPADAAAMVAACRSAGVQLMTAFPCRFSPSFQQLRRQVQDGQLGEVYAVCGTNRGKCPGGWFVDPALSGGGAITDHTVHVTDLLRDLLQSEAKEVYCEASNGMHHSPDFEDCGIVTITFENGVFATLDASWSRPATFPTWGDVTMVVTGAKGVATLDMFGQESTLFDDTNKRVASRGWGSNIDSGLVAAFVDAIEKGVAVPITGVDGLRAVEVVDAAYRSIASGQPAAVHRLD